MNHYYMNLETGELLTMQEMLTQAREMYGIEIPHAETLWKYYELTDIEI